MSLSNVEALDQTPDVQAANRQYYEEAIVGMCKRLAVVSVDYLRDKVVTSRVLARLQQSDHYLGQVQWAPKV